jgi:hypothetical protein
MPLTPPFAHRRAALLADVGTAHPASFRDPSAFVFSRGGVLYRQINESGRTDYEQLMQSGLYEELSIAGDLIRHEEAATALSPDGRASRLIQPERIPFISYPYEWCFSQLKDAALLTLRLQRLAMAHGMGLKDATPYNVAFRGGRPIWIDTTSFSVARQDEPWVAYRQFCEMFLAPLALISLVDVRLLELMRTNLDGIPLDLTSTLLPVRSKLRPGLLMHVHLHAAAQRPQKAGGAGQSSSRQLSKHALAGLIDSLNTTVQRLEWRLPKTTWGDYYEATNYDADAFGMKRAIVDKWIERVAPNSVWDVGANDGTFSRLASSRGIMTIAFDVDPVAVEKNYLAHRNDSHMLPLRLDLTNPSSRQGWANAERDALSDRGPADLALMLALVHHLAIGHNVPLARIAAFVAEVCRALVIEFVPKEDSQVQRMLASRVDIFDQYTQEAFESAFSRFFVIEDVARVGNSARVLYLMRAAGRAPEPEEGDDAVLTSKSV